MIVFKRGFMSYLNAIVVAIVAPVFIFFILSLFNLNEMILFGVPALFFLFLMYSATFSEDIKFEVGDDSLIYYKRKKLVYEFKFVECEFRYQVKQSSNGADSANLYVTIPNQEDEIYIDCMPLGIMKFYKMFEFIEQRVPKSEEKKPIKATKKFVKAKKKENQ